MENIDLFLEYFGIVDKAGWKTKTAFIVNHVYSSAFTGSKIEFILVLNDSLISLLTCMKT